MRLLTYSLAGLVLAGVPQTCLACHVVRSAVSYAAPAYVAPVAIATFVPVQVTVPAYSVGYSADAEALLSLKAELKGLREEIAAARANAPAPPVERLPMPQEVRPSYLGVLQSRCASCHDAAMAEAKGGKLALLVGDKPAPLTAEQVLRVLARTKDDQAGKQMPLNRPPLTDAEYTALLGLLNR